MQGGKTTHGMVCVPYWCVPVPVPVHVLALVPDGPKRVLRADWCLVARPCDGGGRCRLIGEVASVFGKGGWRRAVLGTAVL